MTFDFGNPDLLQQSFWPILLLSLVIAALISVLVYKIFGLSKWATAAISLLMLTACATFSSFSLSTIFYRLTVSDNTVELSFAFPYRQTVSKAFSDFRYVDAIRPSAEFDSCHVVLEENDGMLYQSMDLNSKDCEQTQQLLASTLQLKPRPPKPKSVHTPPLPSQEQPH
jgi:hypothetical protein